MKHRRAIGGINITYPNRIGGIKPLACQIFTRRTLSTELRFIDSIPVPWYDWFVLKAIAIVLPIIGVAGLSYIAKNFSVENVWYWVGGFLSLCFVVIPIVLLCKRKPNSGNNRHYH